MINWKMNKPKTIAEFNKFCDESAVCVCGRLMTGLHESGCGKLRTLRFKLMEKEKKVGLV